MTRSQATAVDAIDAGPTMQGTSGHLKGGRNRFNDELLSPAMQTSLKNHYRMSLSLPSHRLTRAPPEEVPMDVANSTDSGLSKHLLSSHDRLPSNDGKTRSLHQSTLLSLEKLIKALETLNDDEPCDQQQESESSINDDEMQAGEEELEQEGNEVRRASDPDVPSAFERNLFEWVDRETKASLEAGMADGLMMMKHPYSHDSSPSDINTEGYGADVEDSPCLAVGQYRIGSTIHTRHSLYAVASRAGKQCHAAPPLPLPQPSPARPREGSMTGRKRSVTITSPGHIAEQSVNVEMWGDPFASLNPFASRSLLYSPRIHTRPRALTTPPCSPLLALPHQHKGEAARATGEVPLTRLQARRPPSLRLDHLPPVDWEALHTQMLPFPSPNPNCDGMDESEQGEGSRKGQPGLRQSTDDILQRQVIGKAPRRPSMAPIMLPRRASRSKTLPCVPGCGEGGQSHDDASPPPPGGFPIPISIRLCGLNTPDSAEIDATGQQQQQLGKHSLMQFGTRPTVSVSSAPLDQLCLPRDREHSVHAWALGTFEATIVEGIDKVNSPARARDVQDHQVASTSTTASEWKPVVVPDDCGRGMRMEGSPASLQPFAYEDDNAKHHRIVSSAAVTIASASDASEARHAMAAATRRRTRRDAQGSQDMVSPMPLRPVRIPNVYQSVAVADAAPKVSPIKRVFAHLPWKRAECMAQDQPMESPLPAAWLASRSPTKQTGSRICSVPVCPSSARASLPAPPSPLPKQRRPVSSLFHRTRIASSPLHPHPRSPLNRQVNADRERLPSGATPAVSPSHPSRTVGLCRLRDNYPLAVGLGLSIATPSTPREDPPSPALIDLSSPILPQSATKQSVLLATNIAATSLYLL